MNSEEPKELQETNIDAADHSSKAALLGIAAGLTAATIAIAFFLRAKRPGKEQIENIDSIIEGVQQRIRDLQEVPGKQLKDIDQIIEGVQEKIHALQSMIESFRKPLSS